MARAVTDVRSLARSYTTSCIRTLAAIVAKSPSPSARVAAAGMLLDRGWGKADQSHSLNGNGDIKVIIRHIIEGRDVDAHPLVIEHESEDST